MSYLNILNGGTFSNEDIVKIRDVDLQVCVTDIPIYLYTISKEGILS